MSTLYPDLSFTNYPNSLDNIALKSNITNSTDAGLVEQIQNYILAGNFSGAANILNTNPQLNGKIFNANDFNTLRDAILALERFYTNDVSLYVKNKQNEWQSQVDRFNFKGVYSPSTQYYQNNMVNYTDANGTLLYLCTVQPPVNTPPSNTSYWRVLTLLGERGASGDGFSFNWIWDATTEYKLNDVVLYGINWWAATQTTKGNEPVSGSPYWSVVLTALPAVQIPVTSSQPTNQILGDQWYQII